MLGADARVVEAGRDRMRVENLPVLVREQRRTRTVQHPGATAAERSGTRSLDADKAHLVVRKEVEEHPDRVRAAADARDDRIRQTALCCEHLRARLAADHPLEVAHYLRVRSWADARADQVVGGVDVCDPVADRLARRLLERARPELDGANLG